MVPHRSQVGDFFKRRTRLRRVALLSGRADVIRAYIFVGKKKRPAPIGDRSGLAATLTVTCVELSSTEGMNVWDTAPHDNRSAAIRRV